MSEWLKLETEQEPCPPMRDIVSRIHLRSDEDCAKAFDLLDRLSPRDTMDVLDGFAADARNSVKIYDCCERFFEAKNMDKKAVELAMLAAESRVRHHNSP